MPLSSKNKRTGAIYGRVQFLSSSLLGETSQAPAPTIGKLHSATSDGNEMRQMLENGGCLPDGISFQELMSGLRETADPSKRGLTLLLTGLPGAGKSTLGNHLASRAREILDRPVVFLDADMLRQHVCRDLGFSKADRDENINRISQIANEFSRTGALAICAAIAPYVETREKARAMLQNVGEFAEVYLSAPLAVCERRDPKGLYSLARQGKIPEFTGVASPYEPPLAPDIVVKSDILSVDQSAAQVWAELISSGKLWAGQASPLAGTADGQCLWPLPAA